jgi:hypothetical protein
MRIRKAQKELGLQVEIFPTLDMWEIEDDDAKQITNGLESSVNRNPHNDVEESYQKQRTWRHILLLLEDMTLYSF